MTNKIRLGFVGANVRSTWASQSHFPALLASPDVELTADRKSRNIRDGASHGLQELWQPLSVSRDASKAPVVDAPAARV